MGGKGSGRPRGSFKPLSKHLEQILADVEDLEDHIFIKDWKTASLLVRILYFKTDTLRRKTKLKESQTKLGKLTNITTDNKNR